MKVSRLERGAPDQRLGGARASFAFAHVASLVLLAEVSAHGLWALGAGALVLFAGLWPSQARGLRADLLSLARIGAGVLTLVAALGTLFVSTQVVGGALAWFGRSAALVGLVAVTRTPARLLSGHALLVALSLWNAAACDDALEPRPLGLGLASAALFFCLQGVLRGHREQLEERSARSITTGVAPTPWGRSPLRLPISLVLALALVPLGLGVSLPRWPLEAPPAAPATRPTPAPLKGSGWGIGFAPELRADKARGAALPGDAEIARVLATPAPPALYLRGAELSRATQRGFFPPLVTPAPLDAQPGPQIRLEVELLVPQSNALFVVGRAESFWGVDAERTRQGWQIARGLEPPSYPLRYELEAQGLPAVNDTDLLRAAKRADFLNLPEGIKADKALRELAQGVAWGRSTHARIGNLNRWLQGRCAYSLTRDRPAGLSLRLLLDHFLEQKRSGVCEEFAAAACVLLRLVEVPARVVTGYRSIERDDQGRFRVRARHAHAWIEVAYEGLGWVPYDPTPPSPGLVSTPSPSASPTPAETPASAAPSTPKAANLSPNQGWAADLWASLANSTGRFRALILVVALLLIVLTRRGGVALVRAQRARQLGSPRTPLPLADLRSRLFALLEAQGFVLDGSETPLEFLRGRPSFDDELSSALEVYLPLRFSARPEPELRQRLEEILTRLERRARAEP